MVLDVEIAVNNRRLIYLGDDVQQPVLTPSSMLQINPTYILESEAHHLADKDLKKRAKFLQECKRVMWNRWSREYVRSLRERHRRAGGKQTPHPKIGEVVIIREEKKPRNLWELAVVKQLIMGRDGIVQGAILKTGKGSMERAVQHLYPLELSCDREQILPLDPTARPKSP